jgi:DNA-directed RNA polymerase specialized sigma24 family protein
MWQALTAVHGLVVKQAILVQQIFVKHQSTLRAFILSLRPDFVEAEDILQEVFLTGGYR